MNIDIVKREIADNMGREHHFVFCGMRNQIEEFDGIIIKMFPAIFLIKATDGSIRSFSYGDYLIQHIKIIS